jgi:hypothetical protein
MSLQRYWGTVTSAFNLNFFDNYGTVYGYLIFIPVAAVESNGGSRPAAHAPGEHSGNT